MWLEYIYDIKWNKTREKGDYKWKRKTCLRKSEEESGYLFG